MELSDGSSLKLPHSHSTPAGVDGGSRTPPATPKKGGKMLAVRVQMLDDSITMFQVQAKALGRVLFDQVCKQLHLLEADYFGLEYQEPNGTKYWLDLEKPMSRQVGLSLVDTLLRFCVKFYTPDPAQLEEEFTRYLFCLQIKRDLAQGLLQCNDNTAALMASYIVQAECGDYVVEDYPDHTYLSSYKFVPNQDQELERRIMENHKKHAGQSPAEADLNLLETSRRCELYGMKMHPAKDHEGVPLNLAVAHMGIVVFQNFTKINTFSWAKIRKISFKRKRFLIKLHPEGYGYYKDTVEFFFEGRNECKNFWKKCVENHGFFRCSAVKHVPRQKTRVLSRGSSFRYSGKTQKQIVEFVRENYVKRQTFQRSQSFRHSSSAHSSVANVVGTSLSAHPLLPLGDNAVVGTPASLSCGSMTLGSAEHHPRGSLHHHRHPSSSSSRDRAGSPLLSPTHTVDIHDFDTRDLTVITAHGTTSPSPPLTTSLSPGTSITSSPQHFYPGGRQTATDDEEQEYATDQQARGTPGTQRQSPYRHQNTGQSNYGTNQSHPYHTIISQTQTIIHTTTPHPTTLPRSNANKSVIKQPEKKSPAARHDWQRSASCRNLRNESRSESINPMSEGRGYYESIYRQERLIESPITRYDDSRRACYSAAGSKSNSVDRGSDTVPDTRIYSSSYPGTTSSLSTESGGGDEPAGMIEAGSECILLTTGGMDSQEEMLYSHDDLSHDSYELLEREDDDYDGDERHSRIKSYSGTRSCSLESSGDVLPMDDIDEVSKDGQNDDIEVFHMDEIDSTNIHVSSKKVLDHKLDNMIVRESKMQVQSTYLDQQDLKDNGYKYSEREEISAKVRSNEEHFQKHSKVIESGDKQAQTHFGEYNVKCEPGLVVGFEDRKAAVVHTPVERAKSDPHTSSFRSKGGSKRKRRILMHQKSIDVTPAGSGESDEDGEGGDSLSYSANLASSRSEYNIPYTLHKRHAMNGTASSHEVSVAAAVSHAVDLLADDIKPQRVNDDKLKNEKIRPDKKVVQKHDSDSSVTVSSSFEKEQQKSLDKKVEADGEVITSTESKESSESKSEIKVQESKVPQRIGDVLTKTVLTSSDEEHAERSSALSRKSRLGPSSAAPSLARKRDRSPILFARARLGLSEGSAFSPVRQVGSPASSRRAKSLDAPVVAVHRLPPADAFSSEDDTVDNGLGPPQVLKPLEVIAKRLPSTIEDEETHISAEIKTEQKESAVQRQKILPVETHIQEAVQTLQEEKSIHSETKRSPEPRKSPELRKSPEPKKLPDIRQSPELRKSPEVRRSPEIRKSPEVRKSPELRKSPEFKKSPEPRKSPDIKRSPEPRKSPDLKKPSESRKSTELKKSPEPKERKSLKHVGQSASTNIRSPESEEKKAVREIGKSKSMPEDKKELPKAKKKLTEPSIMSEPETLEAWGIKNLPGRDRSKRGITKVDLPEAILAKPQVPVKPAGLSRKVPKMEVKPQVSSKTVSPIQMEQDKEKPQKSKQKLSKQAEALVNQEAQQEQKDTIQSSDAGVEPLSLKDIAPIGEQDKKALLKSKASSSGDYQTFDDIELPLEFRDEPPVPKVDKTTLSRELEPIVQIVNKEQKVPTEHHRALSEDKPTPSAGKKSESLIKSRSCESQFRRQTSNEVQKDISSSKTTKTVKKKTKASRSLDEMPASEAQREPEIATRAQKPARKRTKPSKSLEEREIIIISMDSEDEMGSADIIARKGKFKIPEYKHPLSVIGKQEKIKSKYRDSLPVKSRSLEQPRSPSKIEVITTPTKTKKVEPASEFFAVVDKETTKTTRSDKEFVKSKSTEVATETVKSKEMKEFVKSKSTEVETEIKRSADLKSKSKETTKGIEPKTIQTTLGRTEERTEATDELLIVETVVQKQDEITEFRKKNSHRGPSDAQEHSQLDSTTVVDTLLMTQDTKVEVPKVLEITEKNKTVITDQEFVAEVLDTFADNHKASIAEKEQPKYSIDDHAVPKTASEESLVKAEDHVIPAYDKGPKTATLDHEVPAVEKKQQISVDVTRTNIVTQYEISKAGSQMLTQDNLKEHAVQIEQLTDAQNIYPERLFLKNKEKQYRGDECINKEVQEEKALKSASPEIPMQDKMDMEITVTAIDSLHGNSQELLIESHTDTAKDVNEPEDTVKKPEKGLLETMVHLVKAASTGTDSDSTSIPMVDAGVSTAPASKTDTSPLALPPIPILKGDEVIMASDDEVPAIPLDEEVTLERWVSVEDIQEELLAADHALKGVLGMGNEFQYIDECDRRSPDTCSEYDNLSSSAHFSHEVVASAEHAEPPLEEEEEFVEIDLSKTKQEFEKSGKTEEAVCKKISSVEESDSTVIEESGEIMDTVVTTLQVLKSPVSPKDTDLSFVETITSLSGKVFNEEATEFDVQKESLSSDSLGGDDILEETEVMKSPEKKPNIPLHQEEEAVLEDNIKTARIIEREQVADEDKESSNHELENGQEEKSPELLKETRDDESPESTKEEKMVAERSKSEEEASSSSSLALPARVELSSTWRPFLLESSGSSSLEEGFFPPDEEETTSSPSNNDRDEAAATMDFPTGFGYPCIGDVITSVGGYGGPGVFALSRTLSRISERSTTSEQERSDLDDDSTKPSSRSPSVDDESLISSDHQPSLSSDPPSGGPPAEESTSGSKPPPPQESTEAEGAAPAMYIPPPLLSDDDWPSPPTSSSLFETPVVSHVETFYMEIHPEEACKVLVIDSTTEPTGGDGSSTDENHTLQDEDDTTLAGTVKVAVRPRHYCAGSSLSEDTSMGLSLSEWSSSTGTVRPQCPLHYSETKSDDTSLDDLGRSIPDLPMSRTPPRSPTYYSGAKSDTCLDDISPTRLGKHPSGQKSRITYYSASKSLTSVDDVPIRSSERPMKVVRPKCTPYYSTAGTPEGGTSWSEERSATHPERSSKSRSKCYSYYSTAAAVPARSPQSDGDTSSSMEGLNVTERVSRMPKRRKSQPKKRHRVTVDLEVRDGQIVEVSSTSTSTQAENQSSSDQGTADPNTAFVPKQSSV